jgi:hypothetical protein
MAVAGSHVDLCVCRVKVPNVAAVQACITPVRLNIVGPLSSTSISVSIVVCYSGKSGSLFGRPVMKLAASRWVETRTRRNRATVAALS